MRGEEILGAFTLAGHEVPEAPSPSCLAAGLSKFNTRLATSDPALARALEEAPRAPDRFPFFRFHFQLYSRSSAPRGAPAPPRAPSPALGQERRQDRGQGEEDRAEGQHTPWSAGGEGQGPAAIKGYVWSHDLPFEPSREGIGLRILRGFVEITVRR